MPKRFGRQIVIERHRRFAEEFLIDLNASAAYVRAGYKANNQSQAITRAKCILNRAHVADYVQQLMDQRSKRVGINADYVINTIYETIERCKQAKPVVRANGEPVMVETPDGEIAPAYAFDSAAVLKGAEMLGKHLKMFATEIKQEVHVKHSGTVEHRSVSEISGRIADLLASRSESDSPPSLPH